jgi:hypothetical protein
MVAVGSFHFNDKLMHFGAYLALSLLPVVGFKDRRAGLKAGLPMFLRGMLMKAGQHFSPGRAVELGDVLANRAGVSCGTLLGLPIRACIAIRQARRTARCQAVPTPTSAGRSTLWHGKTECKRFIRPMPAPCRSLRTDYGFLLHPLHPLDTRSILRLEGYNVFTQTHSCFPG